MFIVLLGSLLLAISSKIKIPFYPVPMTMQTFVVLFIGIAFGWKLGLATISLYLFEGILGLPVFSGTPEKGLGLVYFTGPTMGYLIGFMITAYLVGKFTYSKLTTNSMGFANGPNGDRDVSIDKPEHLYRINCLGASTTGFTLYLFTVYGAFYWIIFFGETLEIYHYIGTILVFFGIF